MECESTITCKISESQFVKLEPLLLPLTEAEEGLLPPVAGTEPMLHALEPLDSLITGIHFEDGRLSITLFPSDFPDDFYKLIADLLEKNGASDIATNDESEYGTREMSYKKGSFFVEKSTCVELEDEMNDDNDDNETPLALEDSLFAPLKRSLTESLADIVERTGKNNLYGMSTEEIIQNLRTYQDKLSKQVEGISSGYKHLNNNCRFYVSSLITDLRLLHSEPFPGKDAVQTLLNTLETCFARDNIDNLRKYYRGCFEDILGAWEWIQDGYIVWVHLVESDRSNLFCLKMGVCLPRAHLLALTDAGNPNEYFDDYWGWIEDNIFLERKLIQTRLNELAESCDGIDIKKINEHIDYFQTGRGGIRESLGVILGHSASPDISQKRS